MFRNNRVFLLLKALVHKTITVPGYTRSDGTYVDPHQKTVLVETDHAPKFHEHKLAETNTNAPSHNKKVKMIARLHEAGDAAGLLGLKHGTNTYGKKQAKLAQEAAGHLLAGKDPETEPAPVEEKPAAPEKHFGEQHPGKVFVEGPGGDPDISYKFDPEKGWLKKWDSNVSDWDSINLASNKLKLNAGKGLKGHPLVEAPEDKQETPPSPTPAPAPTAPAADAIDWEKYKLAPTNSNAPSINKKIDAIKAAWSAGDVAALEAMKFGVNTYNKMCAKLRDVAVAHIKESGAPPAAESAPEPKISSHSKLDWSFTASDPALSGAPSYTAEKGEKFYHIAYDGDQYEVGMTDTVDADMPPEFEHFTLAEEVHGYLSSLGVEGPKLSDLAKLKDGGSASSPASPSVAAETPDAVLAPPPTSKGWYQSFQNTEPGHNKFWTVSVNGTTVTKTWGKNGTVGQSKDWEFSSPAAAKKGALDWAKEKQAKGYKLMEGYLGVGDAIDLNASADAQKTGPKDGDTKPAADGGVLVFKDGRWHKQGHPLVEAINAVPVPASLAASPGLAKFKNFVLTEGAPAFKRVKKIATSSKWSPGGKKLSITLKGCRSIGGDVKWSGFVTAKDGVYEGQSVNGTKAVQLFAYIEALKAAHKAAGGGSVPASALPPAGAPVAPAAAQTAAPAPAPAPTPAPKPAPPAAPKIVASVSPTKKLSGVTVTVIDKWKNTGGQQGSNPGGTYVDGAGQAWYVKFPKTSDHALNELLAAKLYKAAGVDVPSLRLIERDGKIGIASKLVDGVSKVGAGIKDAEGALDGFAVDAWLANYDSVGTGFDNLLRTKDGKAIRIDVGGSLLYRAKGDPKTDFGEAVNEIDNMRNTAKNSYAAAVFGKITPEQLDNSVALVLDVPDDVIKQIVSKFGPGTEKDKTALADKLIARKAWLAKKFPGADAIANPPKPDPRKLPVEPSKLPTKLNFLDWNGTGKGLSSVDAVNQSNQKAVDAIYGTALKGDYVAVKDLKFDQVNKQTGAVEKKVSFGDHPSQHVKDFYSTVIDYMEVIANPAAKKAKSWDIGDYSDITELSEALPAHFYGVTVGHVPANQRLGFWISLGQTDAVQEFVPPDIHYITKENRAKGVASNQDIPPILRTWMKAVKSSGSANQPYRDGKEIDNSGNRTRDVLAAAYKHSVEFDEGTRFTKGISIPDAMMKQLLDLQPGHVFQNPGSMCTSMKEGWSWSGDTVLDIVAAKGARGLYNLGIHKNYDGEDEMTTVPGQRFMLLESDTSKKPKRFKLLMLPPDETYVANIHPKG